MMVDMSRPPARSGPFRSTLVLVIAVVLALITSPSAQTQNQDSKQFPDWKDLKAGAAIPLNFKPSTAGIPDTLSPLLKMSAAALMSPGSESRVNGMQSGAPAAAVMNVEFDSAASRQRLRLPGVSVLTAVDRFVELFVPLNREGTDVDPAVMQALIASPGFVWDEVAGAVELPPAPQFRVGAPTRAVPEQIVHGGYAGFQRQGSDCCNYRYWN